MNHIKFTFNVGKHTLVFKGNSLGKESIYLDGICIKSIRKFGLSSRHIVEIDNIDYELIFSVKNPFGSKCYCQLSKKGSIIESKALTARLGEKNKVLSVILLLVSCGSIGLILPLLGS